MPAPQNAPAWAMDLYIAFESGASGQFVLYGNVHDRLAVGARLVNIERYIQDELLGSFDVVFSYDLGNGLTVERGSERLAQWVPAAMRSLPQQPLEAIRFISRYGRYLANLNAIGRKENVQVAVIIRGSDQLLPADGTGYEHGSLTSLVREWGSGAPFTQLSFVSLLIADNLNDLEPLIAFAPPGDSGLSGRLYSMIAQEMSDTANRGKVVWVLASSRPDLIEVDLKRPGRIDLKIPILPTTTRAESRGLIAALARRYELSISSGDLTELEPQLPLMLTPGAAEALVVKAYRVARTENVSGGAALLRALDAYQNPVPQDVLEKQMRLAVREATDLSFVPESLRYLAAPDTTTGRAP